ncbi:regulator of volume decrease after cellular swelling-domain-containing protein [Aspergillus similis]
MEILSTPPNADTFVSIDTYQSRTPESFHDRTILYYNASQCSLHGLKRDLTSTPELKSLWPSEEVNGSAPGMHESNGEGDGEDESEEAIVTEGLEIWVTSDKFFVYNTSISKGLSIPYRSISLHAIQRLKLPTSSPSAPQEPPVEVEVQGLYMHIAKPASESSFPQESDEEESLTVTIVPPTPAITPEGEETEIQKLYNAVSACANLHPDPVEEEDQDSGAFASGLVFPGAGQEGGLPPPMHGSSGWITADNMHEFFDEEGNWIGEGEGPSFPGMGSGLGPGAGSVRGREEEMDEHGDADGDAGVDGEETKWRRTD